MHFHKVEACEVKRFHIHLGQQLGDNMCGAVQRDVC